MRLPTHLGPLLVLIAQMTSLSLAAQSATSFCKCVCAGNSTIIALNPPTGSEHSSLKFSRSIDAVLPRDYIRIQSRDGEEEDERDQQHHKPTCADCNRAFCLDQGLKICADVKAEEVFAACFQRDSLKDELVVILFLVCTGGLLGWAVLKPWVEKLWSGSSAAGLALPSAFSRGRRDQGTTSGSRGGFSNGTGGGAGGGSSRRRAGEQEDDEEPLRPT